MYRVITPQSDTELERYYYLRWRVLREPFQRPLGSEQDEYDQVGHHRMVVNEADEAVAVVGFTLTARKKHKFALWRLHQSTAARGMVLLLFMR